jgi:hypothetical protein
MNTDHNPDLVPDDPEDPEFIKAALLLQKIWDLYPDSRPSQDLRTERNSPKPLPVEEPLRERPPAGESDRGGRAGVSTPP